MTAEFTFDEATHTYRLGGQVLPSVTQVLDSVGLISPFAKDQDKALRGSLIHKACKLLAQGRLDWSTVDPRILGKVLAYQRFLEDNPIEPLELEVSHYHSDYLYAGTPDALVWTGKSPPKNILYDIKTGSPAKHHALQTAAYAAFYRGPVKRYTLFLYDDERYNLKPHSDRSDWPDFVSCLNVHRLKEAA